MPLWPGVLFAPTAGFLYSISPDVPKVLVQKSDKSFPFRSSWNQIFNSCVQTFEVKGILCDNRNLEMGTEDKEEESLARENRLKECLEGGYIPVRDTILKCLSMETMIACTKLWPAWKTSIESSRVYKRRLAAFMAQCFRNKKSCIAMQSSSAKKDHQQT